MRHDDAADIVWSRRSFSMHDWRIGRIRIGYLSHQMSDAAKNVTSSA